MGELGLAVLMLAVFGRRAPDRFWLSIAGPAVLLACALAWAALPDLLRPAPPGGDPGRPAPDLLNLELVKLAGAGAMVLVGALIGRNAGRASALLDWMVVFDLAHLALSFFLAWQDPNHVWGVDKSPHRLRFTGTFLNANVAGCAFGMSALVAFGRLQLARVRLGRADEPLEWLIGGAALVALGGDLVACAMTGSRMSFAATSLALAAAVAFTAGKRGRRAILYRLLLVSLGLAACAALAALTLIGQRYYDLPQTTFGRLEAWERLFSLTRERPLTGFGLGAFEAVHLARLDAHSAISAWNFGAGHCAYLQAALEGGWPFLALLVAAGAVIAWQAFRDVRSASRVAVLVSCTGAAGVALVCGTVDICLNVPAVTALLMLLIGVAWGRAFIRKQAHGGADKARTGAVSRRVNA
jgi:O-antigen ligase